MKEFFNWKSLATITTSLCFSMSVATFPSQARANEGYCGEPQECCVPCAAPSCCLSTAAVSIGAIALAGLAGWGIGESFHKKGHRGHNGGKGDKGQPGATGLPGNTGAPGTTSGGTGPSGGTGVGPSGATGNPGPTGGLPFENCITFEFLAAPAPAFTIDVFVVDPEGNVFTQQITQSGFASFNFNTSGGFTPFLGDYKWGFYFVSIPPNDSAFITSPVLLTIFSSCFPSVDQPLSTPSQVYTVGDQYIQDFVYDPLATPNPLPLP